MSENFSHWPAIDIRDFFSAGTIKSIQVSLTIAQITLKSNYSEKL